MIHLDTTDKIQIVLASAVTTNQLHCVATWADLTTTPSYNAGRSVVLTNSTTAVDLVASPAASTIRRVRRISIYNADTVAATVTVMMDVSGTDKIIWKGTIDAGGSADLGATVQVCNAAGLPVTAGVSGTDGTDGADGVVSVQEAEIDFGAAAKRSKTFTVTDASVSPSSRIIAYQSGDAATGRDADENEMDALVLRCVPGTGEFTVYADSLTGPVSGLFKINYLFS